MGAKPAAVYGCSVNGFNDRELLKLRRALLHAHSPSGTGISLRLRLALLQDPAWEAAVAPALQWSRQVWKASTPELECPAELTINEMLDMWRRIKPAEEDGNWAQSRGPLRRAVLSLQRIGWQASTPFMWTTDEGLDVFA